MDLRSYTRSLPNGGVQAFAARVGITPIYLAQLAVRQNDRQPSPSLCVRLEAESAKAVRRWDLRPDDWHLIWPELVRAKGAPQAPETAKA